MEKFQQGFIHFNIIVRKTSGKRSINSFVGFEEENNSVLRRRNIQKKKDESNAAHVFAKESSPLDVSLQQCNSEIEDDSMQIEDCQACASASTAALQQNMEYRVERADELPGKAEIRMKEMIQNEFENGEKKGYQAQKNDKTAVNHPILLILALSFVCVRKPTFQQAIWLALCLSYSTIAG